MVNIPENPYDRILTSDEIKELTKDGWTQVNSFKCDECFGTGCKKCHQSGIISTYRKEGKYIFGSPYLSFPDTVGAICKFINFGHKINFCVSGHNGSAELYFTIPQMVKLMKMTINMLDNIQEDIKEEFGIEAQFRGPPVMFVSSLSKDRVTMATILNKNQQKAVDLLSGVGLENEAMFLKSAYEHEIFRGDEEENRKAREAIGEVEPGTIFSRK
ncbi:MAG: hypothetical protein WC516_08995 [Patescibacteria group bacterium]|jgi:hypothetical protein